MRSYTVYLPAKDENGSPVDGPCRIAGRFDTERGAELFVSSQADERDRKYGYVAHADRCDCDRCWEMR